MFRFAICDDNDIERKEIRCALDEYIGTHTDIQAEVKEFSSPLGLEDSIEAGYVPAILLLDICMPVMSGITLARQIRSKKFLCKIIFLTTSRDYAVEAFKLEASHYLVKPFSKKDFDTAIDRSLEAFKTQPKRISITSGAGVTTFIEIDDIIYIESQGYRRYVYTKNETLIESKRNLTQFIEAFEELSKGQFIIPYRGYIINLNEIRTITSKYIEMQNGVHILIKSGDYAKIKKSYFDYSFVQGGGITHDKPSDCNACNKHIHVSLLCIRAFCTLRQKRRRYSFYHQAFCILAFYDGSVYLCRLQ